MSEINLEKFARASKEAVKNELRSTGWPVYKHYEICEEDGEPFGVAPISFTSFFESEPEEEGILQKGELEGMRWQKFAGRRPEDDSMALYAPLRTPELVLELAALADKEITSEDVLGWAEVYGLLGIPDDDAVRKMRASPASKLRVGDGRTTRGGLQKQPGRSERVCVLMRP